MNNRIQALAADALGLLQKLIATQSFSKEELPTALIIEAFMQERGVETNRLLHNIWAKNRHYDESKPTILLNSHHDTVRPNKGYTRDPLLPEIIDGKLFGLGSNDAGVGAAGLHVFARGKDPCTHALEDLRHEQVGRAQVPGMKLCVSAWL